MKEKFVKVLRKNGSSLAINIPSEIVDLLSLKEGNVVRVEVDKIK